VARFYYGTEAGKFRLILGDALPLRGHGASFSGPQRFWQMTTEPHGDVIRLEQIEVLAHLGVPDDERAEPQRLTISVSFWPRRCVAELNDEIDNAVNYAEVCDEVRRFVESRDDKLLETLADTLAARLLDSFAIRCVAVEIRKFILPKVKFVSVSVTRERAKE
jgi:FolB domain-containing protein